MNYVVKGLYLHLKILHSIRLVHAAIVFDLFVPTWGREADNACFFVFNKRKFCVGSILQIHEI